MQNKMKLFKRFISLFDDPLKTIWATRPVNISKIELTFEDGRVRMLEGDTAKEYFKDIWFSMNGRKVDYTRHQWKETKPKA